MNCPHPVGLRVGEPLRGQDRCAVEVEGVDLVVVEGGDDLEGGVVVDVADGDVLAVRAVAVVAHLVEPQVVALPAQLVVAGPGRVVAVLGLEEPAAVVEDEDLRAGR
jgi:nitrogen fixation protein